MCGKMPCVVDRLTCFLHALVEICLIWEQCSPEWLNPLAVCLCVIPEQLCPWSTAGLCRGSAGPRGAEPSDNPSWVTARGALAGLSQAAVRREDTSSCSWQFHASLGWSCKALFCFWFLLRWACPGFTGCLWFLVQILLVVHTPWLPDPSLGFSLCFLFALQLSSFEFLGPKRDHAFLFKPLSEPNSFLSPLALGRARSPCVSVSAPPSKPSSRLSWLPTSCPPGFNIG